jgi:hypothetical protein
MLFGEPGSKRVAERLQQCESIYASTLLEAELQAAAVREGVAVDARMMDALHWVHPDRRLTLELARVFEAGPLRGADAWHLACALFLVESPADIPFLTLDERQRAAAQRLGFVS